jgi:putative acetyltransferase
MADEHMRTALPIRFVQRDLDGEAVRALVARHLRGMQATSPPESVHALGVEQLRAPDVTFWTAWVDAPEPGVQGQGAAGAALAAMGALKRLDAERGEVKSMRVADAFLGRGVGRAMLAHIVAHARTCGFRSLWLETGTTPDFAPALQLYRSAGFVDCGPFADYGPDPFSTFMTRTL